MGYSGVNFGHLKSEVFRNGVGGGVGYSGVNFGHLKSEVFRNGGGAFWSEIPEISGKFGQKFTVQPETCLRITDSLSHTTYVETNDVLCNPGAYTNGYSFCLCPYVNWKMGAC